MKNFDELLEIHRKKVESTMNDAASEINERAKVHDMDKKDDPRIHDVYKEYFPKLKKIPHATKEYYDYELAHFQEAHFLHVQNRHHFYDYRNKIEDVDLFDLLEAIIDINESSKQYNEDYTLEKTVSTIIEKGIADQDLVSLINNTLKHLNESKKNK